MAQRQTKRVQRLTTDDWNPGDILSAFWQINRRLHSQIRRRRVRMPAVHRIRDDRMSDMSHMDSQLMGATSFRQHSQIGRALVTLDHFIPGDGISCVPAFLADLHLLAMLRVHPDESIDPVLIKLGAAPDDRPVLLDDFALLELLAESAVNLIVFRDDDDARRRGAARRHL